MNQLDDDLLDLGDDLKTAVAYQTSVEPQLQQTARLYELLSQKKGTLIGIWIDGVAFDLFASGSGANTLNVVFKKDSTLPSPYPPYVELELQADNIRVIQDQQLVSPPAQPLQPYKQIALSHRPEAHAAVRKWLDPLLQILVEKCSF
jgi:hypothetical protein